mmetsp:Transcript_448/g.1548  ORF Transcript_448/g.1548 Transcript_448/m.1548 type:complete len:677 (+) Transcript_448:176-2206(+)|eukprot:CAMPEP_0198727162 /NCGR_PEP_ID=MMETSP1475-20131203/3977_1 /TAXON_ID= ORGANISM="Unidentified sp., Strain CCMP1999" /NCGR_SAMPLE_ID=MMETSP1475 /ASSEMBLY_ACC=CAM_ASM_001111 /LENGTH=676 /DNA_ID=CAMNT_0044489171 /DNA_START=98 /DNA_END=2128 /DNA_ORIENTATION=+
MASNNEVETIKLNHIRRARGKKTEKILLEDRLGPEVLKRLEAMAHEYVRFERGQFGFFIDPARYAVRQRQIGPMGRGRRRQVIAGVDKDGNVIKAWIGVDNRLERGGKGEFINIPMDFEKAALGGSDFGPGLGPGEGGGPGGGGGKGKKKKKKKAGGDDESDSDDDSDDDSDSDSGSDSGSDSDSDSDSSDDKNEDKKDDEVPDAPEEGPEETEAAAAVVQPAAASENKTVTDKELQERMAPPPPKPAGGPVNPKANERQGRQKKQLHWVKIPNNLIPGTLWQTKLDDSRVPVKLEDLDELFGVDSTPKFEIKQEEARPEVLPHKRKHNVNILLANLRMSAKDILDVIRTPTYITLDPATLQGLLIICPTPEEEMLLKENIALKDQVDQTDKFMFELIQMPGLRGKILCALAAKSFNEEALDVIRDMDTYAMIPVEVMNSNKLARILEVILALGNTLNSGTNKGGAHGYKLEALAALQTVKDCNGLNLQDYLVDFLQREYPGLLPIDDMPALPQSENISLDAINDNVQHLLESINSVNDQVRQIGADPTLAKFKGEMEKFLVDANKAREEIVSLRGLMMKKLEELMGYFGERNKSARGRQEDTLRMLREFVVELSACTMRWEERKERENKQKKEDKKKKAEERKKKKEDKGDAEEPASAPPPPAAAEEPAADAGGE